MHVHLQEQQHIPVFFLVQTIISTYNIFKPLSVHMRCAGCFVGYELQLACKLNGRKLSIKLLENKVIKAMNRKQHEWFQCKCSFVFHLHGKHFSCENVLSYIDIHAPFLKAYTPGSRCQRNHVSASL